MRRNKVCPQDWLPPHCPNHNCIYHKEFSCRRDFKKIGYYTTLANPNRIPRFLCKQCHRSFSRQTFSTTYWQKQPDLDGKIFMKAVGCMANRQIARDLNVCPETVSRHVARLGRHCLLIHQQQLLQAQPFTEIVIDGFESFEFSQYFPIHHHVAVDKKTGFLIYFTDSELRRKGRMTPYQKRRRAVLEAQLGKAPAKAVEIDMAETVSVALIGASSAVVYSDEHPAYRRSLRRLSLPILHRVTNSKQRRTQRNPLWEVNLLELLIRHGSSNHKRETIAFSKRRQCSAEKLAIMLVWRNYMKCRSENRCQVTPAMALGLVAHRWSVSRLLSGRIFRSHVDLPPRWAEYYVRGVQTRASTRNRGHELKYAF